MLIRFALRAGRVMSTQQGLPTLRGKKNTPGLEVAEQADQNDEGDRHA
jgi:hypothetical protein